MSEHTPGPWYTFGNGHCVGGPEGTPGAGEGIAMCAMRARTPDEARANASLIAAAPEMLAALHECVAWIDELQTQVADTGEYTVRTGFMLLAAAENARAAIAKAKGGVAAEG